MKKLGFFGGLLILTLLIGEIACVVKFVKCDFKAPYKAEAIYGLSAITGLGGIVGYCKISDGENPK